MRELATGRVVGLILGVSFRLGMDLEATPGPGSGQLYLERPTKKGSDEDNEAQDTDALEGGIDSNRPNNIRCD